MLQRNRFCRHMIGRMRPGMFPRVDTELLKQHSNSLQPEDTRNLVFIEPRTSHPFAWREWTVTRTGFPISHARAITSTACQGRTMRDGVIIDCGRHEAGSHKKEEDDWWLDLYVMLSRATRLEDLLLIRAPDLSWFAKGPPKTLQKQLAKLTHRTETCRRHAKRLANELGFAGFLRQE